MKKILFGALVLFLMVACEGNKGSETGDNRYNRTADSLAQEEAIRQAQEAAQEAIEQERLDSIRQDSIRQEEKMKLGQLSFISHNGDWKKILPKFGFKLTSKKTYLEPNEYDEEETWTVTDYVYTRDLNGRKVTFKYFTYDGYGGYCATMIIHDQAEKDKFIQDVKRLNKVKVFEDVIWRASNIDHYVRYLKGEFMFDTDH